VKHQACPATETALGDSPDLPGSRRTPWRHGGDTIAIFTSLWLKSCVKRLILLVPVAGVNPRPTDYKSLLVSFVVRCPCGQIERTAFPSARLRSLRLHAQNPRDKKLTNALFGFACATQLARPVDKWQKAQNQFVILDLGYAAN
jgi:hypothetical protein